MRSIKVLQLASYRGNIGDNANVVGTRVLLNRTLGCHITYTNLEYLEYEPDSRWGGRRFDEGFVQLANAHDLVLIGGGGFFELAVDKSCTGTPIDLPPERLREIHTPIVFYALGFDLSYGIRQPLVDRFRTFLDCLLSRPRTLVSLRNDGSMENLRQVLGDAYQGAIHKVPDGGFFTVAHARDHAELPRTGRLMALNLAGDRLEYRFDERRGEEGNLHVFLEALAEVLNEWFSSRADTHAVLVPHIPEDLNVIWRLMEHVGPPFSRRRLTVAPYIHGEEAQNYLFDIYRRAQLVLGMRFHANVCPIGLGVPTVGLITHPQVAALYRELDLSERAVVANDGEFGRRIGPLIAETLSNAEDIRRRYARLRERLVADTERFHVKIRNLLETT
ncbi:MAG: polysaccharide pyruvyl transferase family protein [Phycisphaerae bacterium]